MSTSQPRTWLGRRGVQFVGPPDAFTRRLLATTLVGQSLIIALGALVARGIAVADDDPDRGMVLLVGGCGLALLCLLVSGVLRRPYGLSAGWSVQVLTFASAIVLPAMVGVGAIFTALWVLSFTAGHKVARVKAQQDEEAEHD